MSLPVYQNTIVNDRGDVLPEALLRVRTDPGQGNVTLYKDRDGFDALTNVGDVYADTEGFVRFYLPPGVYRMHVVAEGYDRIYRHVQVEPLREYNVVAAEQYELAITDAGNNIQFISDNPVDVEIPTDEDVEFPMWSEITLIQAGDGIITLSGDVTIQNPSGGPVKSMGKGSSIHLTLIGGDVWLARVTFDRIIEGDIEQTGDLKITGTITHEGNSTQTGNSNQTGDAQITGRLDVDNLRLDGNTVSSTNSNGDVDITPAGSGKVRLNKDTAVDGDLDVAGDTVLHGNLRVKGTATIIDSTEVDIGDNIIRLNANETGEPTLSAGFEIERGLQDNVSFLWDEFNDRWTTGGQPLHISNLIATGSATIGGELVRQMAFLDKATYQQQLEGSSDNVGTTPLGVKRYVEQFGLGAIAPPGRASLQDVRNAVVNIASGDFGVDASNVVGNALVLSSGLGRSQAFWTCGHSDYDTRILYKSTDDNWETDSGVVELWTDANLPTTPVTRNFLAAPTQEAARQAIGAAAVGEGDGGVKLYQSVSEMVADEELAIGDVARTLEHTTGYGYGGGNLYKIVAGGTGTHDNGSYIDLDNGLQAMGLFPNGVNVKQFGATGDGVTDDTVAIIAADSQGPCVFPVGTYRVTSNLVLTNFATFEPGAVIAPASPSVTVMFADEQDEIDAAWFGVVGGGVSANEASKIQQALDSGAGRTVVIRTPGIHNIQALLQISSGTTLVLGDRTIIRRNSGIEGMLVNRTNGQGGFNGAKDITVTGGVFDGNKTGIGGWCTSVAFGHATNVAVERTIFKDTPVWHSIELNAVKRGRVEFCKFLDCDRSTNSECIQIDLMLSDTQFPWFGPYDYTPCEDIVVENNEFINVGAGVGTHSSRLGSVHRGIYIKGNLFRDVATDAVRGLNWADVKVNESNKFENVGNGVVLQAHSGEVCEGVQVSDNTFSDCNQLGSSSRAVHINGGTRAQRRIRNVSVTGNMIEDVGRHGIGVDFCTGITVSGNKVTRCQQVGIWVFGSNNFTVTGNNSTGNNLDSTPEATDINVGGEGEGPSAGGAVTGNSAGNMVVRNSSNVIATANWSFLGVGDLSNTDSYIGGNMTVNGLQ